MGCAVRLGWRLAILAAISLVTVNFAAAEPLPRSVLVINQSGPNRPWIVGFSTALRNILQADPSGPISLYIEDLDLTEFRSPEYEASVLDFLRVKYRNKSIGVVVSLGSLAYPYALHMRTKMWPGAPMVFSMMDEVMATGLAIPPGVTGTFMRLTLQEMVEAAHTLVPGLRNVALVGDHLEKQSFYRHFAEELPGIAAKLQIIDLSGLPLEQVERRVGELPDRTAILYTRHLCRWSRHVLCSRRRSDAHCKSRLIDRSSSTWIPIWDVAPLEVSCLPLNRSVRTLEGLSCVC